MENMFTLDDLNKVLEKKYGPFVFQAGREKFVLQQIVRLPREVRDQVKVLIESLDTDNKEEQDEETMLSTLGEVIKLVCDKGEKLLEVLDNDLLKISILFEQWMESTQPGEA